MGMRAYDASFFILGEVKLPQNTLFRADQLFPLIQMGIA